MVKNQKIILTILISLPIIAFIGSIIQQILHGLSGWTNNPLWIGYIASILVTINSFLFRYMYADVPLLMESLIGTSFSVEERVKPRRFLNWLPNAMLVGIAATIAIHQNFLIGMGLYFVMQVLLIIAYTGIVDLRFKSLLSKERRLTSIIIIGFWIIYTVIVFPLLILPGLDGLMLVLVPIYVASLIIMGIIAYLQLPYRKRALGMRLALVFGATSFIFSDTLIGYTVFVNPFVFSSALIQPTYVLAIVLISSSVLFLERDIKAEK